MLFFLPDKHRKIIRYYGIYASNIERKLDYMEQSTWARAIKHCFDKEPEKCPEVERILGIHARARHLNILFGVLIYYG